MHAITTNIKIKILLRNLNIKNKGTTPVKRALNLSQKLAIFWLILQRQAHELRSNVFPWIMPSILQFIYPVTSSRAIEG